MHGCFTKEEVPKALVNHSSMKGMDSFFSHS